MWRHDLRVDWRRTKPCQQPDVVLPGLRQRNRQWRLGVLGHRWVVTQVETDDPYTDNEDSIVTYDYGDPWWGLTENPVLHSDSQLCGTKEWTSWRGFDEVTVTVKTRPYNGAALETIAETKTEYFQGMHKDPQSYSGCSTSNARTVQRTYGNGDVRNDYYWYSGRVIQTTLTEPGGAELSRSETEYKQSTAGGGLYGKRFTYVYEDRAFIEPGQGEIYVLTRHIVSHTSGRETETRYYGAPGQ